MDSKLRSINDSDDQRKATLETILKRNNSIQVVKQHAIPYGNLHKKTYFNALEKILISPKNLKKVIDTPEPKVSIHETALKAFEDVFKKPPSRLGDDQPQPTGRKGKRQGQQQKNMAMSTINVMARNRKKHTGDAGEDSDNSEYSGVGKIDANWFD